LRIQAILLAGDGGASKAVRGASKAFVEIAGKPMVVHVVEALLHTPEVSEVFATGDTLKLEKAFAEHGCVALSAARGRALHVVPQGATLYENIWNSFLRSLPPTTEPDPEHAVLVVPSDIPLVIPQEISEFLAKAAKLEADYVIGLTPEEALEPYRPHAGEPGIEMAYFNLREGRLRQNNLHCVRPLKMRNRHYVQDMYENRYQKEWGNMLRLAWRVLSREWRNLWVLGFYLVMHVAGVLQRRGYRRLSDWVRQFAALPTVERGMSDLLQTRVLCTTTGLGGAALDIDNSEDLEVAERMFARWKREQQARAGLQHGA
jgi:GTP:adenosylcobinamide-phosphate guanylyltransferase